MSETWIETQMTWVGEGCRFEGKVELDGTCRFHGWVKGDLIARTGSKVVLAETSFVEGSIRADDLVIDGFVRGDIVASSRLLISRTGRVIGNVRAGTFQVEPGAHFEGECATGVDAVALAPRASADALPAH